ncbi:MAG TPA: class I SAM-dependent methyltransferase [bacterium]|nr:class I SAM-dependent methyltransferase [bacterium]HPP30076.1 class I SAM-dependent methyltransferase [bacterium]
METEKNCLICGNSNFKVLHLIKETIYKEQFYIMQCKNCHFIFTNPVLSSKELSRFYPLSYYSFIPRQVNFYSSPKRYFKKNTGDRLKVFLLTELGYDFATKDFLSLLLFPFFPLYKYTVSEVYPRKKEGGYLLDVGCGCGEYIVFLKQLGWNVFGIDTNLQAVINGKKAYGLDIFCGEVLDAKFPDNFFDTITMHAVLEHISEPIITLKELRRILKKDGEIIISVPNVWNWEKILFRKFWWGWDTPRHIWHFSPISIKKLLEKTGFQVTKINYIGDMYNFMKNFTNMLQMIPSRKFSENLFSPNRCRFITKYLMFPISIIGVLTRTSENFVIYAKKI